MTSSSSVRREICLIPRGKPIRTEPPVEGKTRAREVQPAQKGGTCFYYALNYIRTRIGKNPLETQKKEREIEQLVSTHRKKITKTQKYPMGKAILEECINQILLAIGGPLSKEQHEIYEQQYQNQHIAFLVNHLLPPSSTPLDVFQEFLQQQEHKDFRVFAETKETQEKINIDTEFLYKALGKTETEQRLSSIYAAHTALDGFNTIPRTPQLSLLGARIANATHQVYSELYQLQEASWNYDQPIANLMQALQAAGPMVIGGQFALSSFREAPSQVANTHIQERPVFSVDETDLKRDRDEPPFERHTKLSIPIYHAILIIGAEVSSTGEQLVYYIDPTESSEEQKVYRMQYSTLQKRGVRMYNKLTNNTSPHGKPVYALQGSTNRLL